MSWKRKHKQSYGAGTMQTPSSEVTLRGTHGRDENLKELLVMASNLGGNPCKQGKAKVKAKKGKDNASFFKGPKKGVYS